MTYQDLAWMKATRPRTYRAYMWARGLFWGAILLAFFWFIFFGPSFASLFYRVLNLTTQTATTQSNVLEKRLHHFRH